MREMMFASPPSAAARSAVLDPNIISRSAPPGR
jgi:hypothetical protein